MNWKSKRKALVINAVFFAVLFGLISLNKEVLRPALNSSQLMIILTGCFPNFIAAFIISLLAVSAVLVKKLKRGRLIIYLWSIAVFVILMIEEFKPMWGASTLYDTFDVIASGVGSTLAILTFELLTMLGKKRNLRTN